MSDLTRSELFHWTAATAVTLGVVGGALWFMPKQDFPGQVMALAARKENAAIIDQLASLGPTGQITNPAQTFPLRVSGLFGGIYDVTQCVGPSGQRFVTGKLEPGNFLNAIRPSKITYSTSLYQDEPAGAC